MSLMRKTQRTTRRLFLRRIGVLLLASVALLSLSAARGSAAVSESDVKAAFIYNCAKFVEWPKDAFPADTAPIQIAVIGDDEFAGKLKTLLADKKAQGRSFEVKRIFIPQEAKNFQIVFISNSENRRLQQILDAAKKSSVLTIGETEQFMDLGGMINLFFEDTQLRFDVNADAAEKAKLVISSKLLRLARRVRK